MNNDASINNTDRSMQPVVGKFVYLILFICFHFRFGVSFFSGTGKFLRFLAGNWTLKAIHTLNNYVAFACHNVSLKCKIYANEVYRLENIPVTLTFLGIRKVRGNASLSLSLA